MKKIASSALILIMLLTLSGCGKDKKTSAPVQGDTAVNVSVFETKKKNIEDTVTYTGEIKASSAASISAKASGVAKAVYKEIGDYVEEGETLLIIDDTDYRTQYNQAQAGRDGRPALPCKASGCRALGFRFVYKSLLNEAHAAKEILSVHTAIPSFSRCNFNLFLIPN